MRKLPRRCWVVSHDRLLEVGPALAAEYLKHVGIEVAKPDVHIRRLIGPSRLAIASSDNEGIVIEAIERMAAQINTSATYIDNLLWLFCADNYGAICGAEPKCHQCTLRGTCNTGRAIDLTS